MEYDEYPSLILDIVDCRKLIETFVLVLTTEGGDMVERRTSNLRIASRTGSANHCYLEQKTLHSLLSTGWFREQIRECFYKLTAFSLQLH